MRTVKLTKESTKDILENLLKRSPNNYGKFESTVAQILDKVKNEGYDTVIPLVFTNPEKQYHIKNTKRRSVQLGEEL